MQRWLEWVPPSWSGLRGGGSLRAGGQGDPTWRSLAGEKRVPSCGGRWRRGSLPREVTEASQRPWGPKAGDSRRPVDGQGRPAWVGGRVKVSGAPGGNVPPAGQPAHPQLPSGDPHPRAAAPQFKAREIPQQPGCGSAGAEQGEDRGGTFGAEPGPSRRRFKRGGAPTEGRGLGRGGGACAGRGDLTGLRCTCTQVLTAPP